MDVTRQKEAEEELRMSERSVSAALRADPLGVALVGPGLPVPDGQPRPAGVCLGYTEQELIGRTSRP